jgi:hypothetical protein
MADFHLLEGPLLYGRFVELVAETLELGVSPRPLNLLHHAPDSSCSQAALVAVHEHRQGAGAR